MAPAHVGRPAPLGATWDGQGTNFAIFSSAAQAVTLCLFDAQGRMQHALPLVAGRGDVWHRYVPEAQPGQRYGWRVTGPYEPGAGLRCNPRKLLLDPYARAIVGRPDWSAVHYGYVLSVAAAEAADGTGGESNVDTGSDTDGETGSDTGSDTDGGSADLSCSLADDPAACPMSEVVDDAFDWGRSTPPRTPWSQTVFYEVHVKGFTKTHPGVPEAIRGSYAGLASPAALAHLKRLGITAVELLPVQAFVDDHRLVEMGLANYWGYNSIGFFAPEQRYAADQSPGGPVREFKAMVRALHEAGIEVILDVVYNHTAEGNHLGPTLGFKGIDHAAYYRLSAEDRRFCADFTGTGNTLDTTSPTVLRLIMDSLRYWAREMHVDGFRFDLATTLGRGAVDFDARHALFAAIAQDPVLADVKLIAEPWDLGPEGYRVGGFPQGWAEWNGIYRDAVRSFWCQREGHLTTLAQRLCGSADLYEQARRPPTDSVNIVTVHDGFTLHDLVSYNEKHNDANGEDNRDGESHNRGWNCGVEGPSDDPQVTQRRESLKRNLLATLLLSQGTPLLLGGDEFGRTQHGNNNGYCQDNQISWFDWSLTPQREAQLAFTERLLALRRALPVLRRARFFSGVTSADGTKDITWLQPDGSEMTDERWQEPGLAAVAQLLCGDPATRVDGDAQQAGDSATSALLLINAGDEPLAFTLPVLAGGGWTARIDTGTANGLPASDGDAASDPPCTDQPYTLGGRAMALLTQPWRASAGPAEQS